MYDKSDPRAALAKAASAPTANAFAAAEYGRFYDSTPQEQDGAGKSWYFRGQNFVAHYMEAKAGAHLVRVDQPDEYAIILPDDDSAITIETGDEVMHVAGGHLAFVPPGVSRIVVNKDARIIRLVTARSGDLAAKAANASAYADQHPNIPPFAPWPAPRDGFRIRAYPLRVAPTPGRFGSIYRCSTMMINMLDPFEGPRDATRMSPHHHDDFEQGSFAIAGDFMHYIRWPWTTDLNAWRADDKEHCASPSLTIIPPPAIHTSRAVGEGTNQLIDIFCPPRVDFSEKSGWVLNANDYPMPTEG